MSIPIITRVIIGGDDDGFNPQGGPSSAPASAPAPAPTTATPPGRAPKTNDTLQVQDRNQSNYAAVVFDENGTRVVDHTNEYAKVDMANLANGLSGVLATAKTFTGNPTAELTPDTRITVDGQEMLLKHAVGAGVVRLVNGQYVEADAAEGPQSDANRQSEANSEPEQVAFAPEVEQFVTETLGPVHPTLQSEMIEQSIVRAFADGPEHVTDLLNINSYAAHTGIEASKLKAALQVAEQSFRIQASAALQRAGVSAEDEPGFIEWATQNRNGDFMTAVRRHVYSRDPRGYAALAKEYLRSVPPSEAAIVAAGYEVQTRRNGETLVKLDGYGWTPISAAVRNGWL